MKDETTRSYVPSERERQYLRKLHRAQSKNYLELILAIFPKNSFEYYAVKVTHLAEPLQLTSRGVRYALRALENGGLIEVFYLGSTKGVSIRFLVFESASIFERNTHGAV